MKRVEELGISPAPWSACTPTKREVAVASLKDDEFRSVQAVALCRAEGRNADARLIAAAPDLYEALRGLLKIVCLDCNSSYTVDGKCVKCPAVVAANDALEKAGGNE